MGQGGTSLAQRRDLAARAFAHEGVDDVSLEEHVDEQHGHAGVGDELERIGDSIAALDAASHAAVMFRRDERRGSALTSSKRAEALARSCGGAMTPALRLATERLPLTSREREILTLAAQGLVTRAVAERLCLSVRTVEGHIYRAMGKTGVATREELIALLREELDGP